MNTVVIDDLKQFISATVSQQGTVLRTEIVNEITEKLEPKIDGLSAGVAEILEEIQTRYDSQLTDHEQRITRLEQKPI